MTLPIADIDDVVALCAAIKMRMAQQVDDVMGADPSDAMAAVSIAVGAQVMLGELTNAVEFLAQVVYGLTTVDDARVLEAEIIEEGA